MRMSMRWQGTCSARVPSICESMRHNQGSAQNTVAGDRSVVSDAPNKTHTLHVR
jgi:hypothetical protein